MDDRVQRDDSVVRLRRELQPGGICADEGRVGHQAAGTLDLHVADIDTRDDVAAGAQIARDRNAATAPEVKNAALAAQGGEELSDPRSVLPCARVVSPIPDRQRVIATPNDLDMLVLRFVGHRRIIP